MPNPYDDIFDGEDKQPKKEDTSEFNFAAFNADDRFMEDTKEPLDEILENIAAFDEQAESFSRLLSQLRVIEHKVDSRLTKLFFVKEDKFNQESLNGERKYHDQLGYKFEKIIVPMRVLAELHLATVQQFNNDIDTNYYSSEKTDHVVKKEKEMAVDGINLQRKILAEGAENLAILTHSLTDIEQRMKSYINVGGQNNISKSEFELIVQKRTRLTKGQNHHFDYGIFDVNLLDKTAISLGIYMKETSTQYLGKLLDALK